MKTNSTIALLSTLALALTACGGSTPEPETPAASAEMEEEAAPEEDEGMDEAMDEVDEEAEEESAEEGGEEEGAEQDGDESEDEGDGEEASGGKKSLKAMKGNRMEKADAEE